jgi:hypothetical protein
VGHDVSTVVGLGWAVTRNGALLSRARGQCDVFVTVDRRLSAAIDSLPFAVVVLRAKSNRLSDLRPLVPFLLNALSTLLPGEVRWIEA